jgi:hypothetical protein
MLARTAVTPGFNCDIQRWCKSVLNLTQCNLRAVELLNLEICNFESVTYLSIY